MGLYPHTLRWHPGQQGTVFAAALQSQPVTQGVRDPLFMPSQAKKFRDRYSYEQVISAGDVSLFHFLNVGIWLPTAIVSRQGNVADLSTAIDPPIGQTRIANMTGGVELSDYLRSTASRAQGMVVVHKGRIKFPRPKISSSSGSRRPCPVI